MKRYSDSRRAAAGGQQPALNKRTIQSFPFPVAPLSDQVRKVATLEEAEAAMRNLRESLSKQQLLSAGLRRAVLATAFSGKLTGRLTDDEIIEEMADDSASVQPPRTGDGHRDDGRA